MELKTILARVSRELLLEKLETDLKNHQKKYNYHKKISDGYLELVKKTQQQLFEVDSNVN
jgi:thymidylate kinase